MFVVVQCAFLTLQSSAALEDYLRLPNTDFGKCLLIWTTKFTHHVSEHFPKFQMITEDCQRRPSKIRRQFDHPPTFLSTVTGSNTVQFKGYDSEIMVILHVFNCDFSGVS